MLKIVLLCIAGFFAALVDSIAGGGGLISVPAYMLALPDAHFVLGTNKFASTTASFTSSLKFAKSGKVNFRLLKFIIPFTFIGAALGVMAALRIDEKFLGPLVLVLVLFVGIYSLFSKTVGQENNFTGLTKKNICLGILLGFSLGFYDGFFGPGTGSFLIFGLIQIFGFDFVNAGGNAKFLNFISNLTSLFMFAISGRLDLAHGILGNINLIYGIPVAIFMIIGARIGTKLALNKGSRLMKPIFVVMSLGVAVKLLYQMF